MTIEATLADIAASLRILSGREATTTTNVMTASDLANYQRTGNTTAPTAEAIEPAAEAIEPATTAVVEPAKRRGRPPKATEPAAAAAAEPASEPAKTPPTKDEFRASLLKYHAKFGYDACLEFLTKEAGAESIGKVDPAKYAEVMGKVEKALAAAP